jgi:hypothetical protein
MRTSRGLREAEAAEREAARRRREERRPVEVKPGWQSAPAVKKPAAAPPEGPRVSSPPSVHRRGRAGRNNGRAPSLPRPVVWRATSASASDWYPWLTAQPLPPVGIPIGRDVFSMAIFPVHPVEWVHRGIVTNPNLFVSGVPGSGKSGLLKEMAASLAAYGTKSLVLGDIKGEYNLLAEYLGVSPIVLGPGSPHRLNPLDGGPLAQHLPADRAERAERLDEVHRRRLMLLKTLMAYRLGRDLRSTEEAALGVALRRATGEDRGGRIPDPLVGEVLAELWALDDDDARTLHAGSAAELVGEVREAGLALRNLLEDSLAGLFDGPTSAPLDFDAPIQTVDVSRLEGRGDDALGLVLSCLSSWGQAAVDDPARFAGAAPRMVIRDELWRSLRYGPLVRKLDADLRLSRAQGTIQVLATHRLADAEASPEAAVARHLVASCATRVMFAQDLSDLRGVAEEVNLTDAEREMVSSWNAANIGRALWHVGPHGRAYVVDGHLTALERRLFHTNERMAV